MLLLNGMRCFLVYVEKMFIIIDKKLSSTCRSQGVLEIIKTGYGAKTKIQKIVKDTNIHLNAITLHKN